MEGGARGQAVYREVYERLRGHRGPLGWWPAETPFEVCLGAILTQNTAWANVEKALGELRRRGLLSYAALSPLEASEIAPLIRASGTHNVKARRVRAFLDFLGAECGGTVEALRTRDGQTLRERLLAVPGIGPETADCILLYAVGLPVFVVDAYTRRLFGRLGLHGGGEPYDAVQAAFTRALPPDPDLFNDFHAQIVVHAKETCRRVPVCPACPLEDLCPASGVLK